MSEEKERGNTERVKTWWVVAWRSYVYIWIYI